LADRRDGTSPSPSPVIVPPSPPGGGCRSGRGGVPIQRDGGHVGTAGRTAAAAYASSRVGRRTTGHHDGAVPALVLDGQPEPDSPASARAAVRERPPPTASVEHLHHHQQQQQHHQQQQQQQQQQHMHLHHQQQQQQQQQQEYHKVRQNEPTPQLWGFNGTIAAVLRNEYAGKPTKTLGRITDPINNILTPTYMF